MFAASVLALGLLAAPFAAAQSMMHTVVVGGSAGNLTFTPEAISAAVGDQVVFQFQQKNHTATQSSFAAPCSHKDGGFASGFMPVAANQTDNFPTFTVTVNDTEPIWVYCGQNAGLPTSHCGAGMVFAVNCGPDGSNTSFTSFKNAALAIGQQLQSEANSTSSAGSSYGGSPYGSAPPATTSAAAAAPPAVSSTSTSSAAVTTHTVTVGANGSLEYSPSEITAQVNDVVVFQFLAKNHTITESSFADPCLKLEKTSTTGQVGFDSGFMPVAANSTSFPTFSIVVNDTTPIWAYCRQTNHCESGMVFAINANDSSAKSFSAFQALANGSNATTGEPSNSTSSNISGASRTVAVSSGLTLGLVGALFAAVL